MCGCGWEEVGKGGGGCDGGERAGGHFASTVEVDENGPGVG